MLGSANEGELLHATVCHVHAVHFTYLIACDVYCFNTSTQSCPYLQYLLRTSLTSNPMHCGQAYSRVQLLTEL